MKKILSTLFLCMTMLATNAYADKDAVRLIIPFAPGGAPDTSFRFMQDSLIKKLGKPVIVDYKPGAGGEIGHTELAQSNPAKLTLAMTTMSVAINGINKDVAPFPIENIKPVAGLIIPTVIVASTKSNIKNLQDLQKHTGHLKFGIPGNGTVAHIIAAQLSKNLKRPITVVPYKGTPQITQDLLSGEIDLAAMAITQTASLSNDGKLTQLAIDSATRHPMYPGLPTFAEFGMAPVINVSYNGILVANPVNAEEMQKIKKAVTEVFQEKELVEKYQNAGFVVPSPIVLPENWLINERNRFIRIVKNLDMSN